METMYDVVSNRLQQRIRKGQDNAISALTKLDNDYNIARDFISPMGKDHTDKVQFNSNGRVKMDLLTNHSFERLDLHNNAIRQLSEKMKIPGQYLSSLAEGTEENKELAAKILNYHSKWQPNKRFLIRSVGDEVRGVLSDQYRRMHALRICDAFLQKAKLQGGIVADGLYTDTKFYMELLIPEPIMLQTPNNGEVAIAFGGRLSTSDYGDGALDLRTFIMQGVCLNGMVRESVMRQVHLGSKLPESLILSERTYELDTQTTVSTISDITEQIFSIDNVKAKMVEIQESSAIEVDLKKELGRLQTGGKLLKSETAEIDRLLMKNDPNDGIQGASTLWKLTQGITAYSREAVPSRGRELQELAGSLIDRVKSK